MFWAVHLGPSGAQSANTIVCVLKTLSLFPPRLWGQREWNPPSYDSRVHGLTRLLETSPPAPPFRLSSCPLVFLARLLVSLLPQGLARRSQIQSDHAMACATVPALASSSSSPRGCSTKVKPTAGWPQSSTSMPHSTGVPHTWPLLVLASRLLYENKAYRWWIT